MSNWKINYPLSNYAIKLLSTYLKFPEGQSITALDWRAGNGNFLLDLTKSHKENSHLYGVEQDKYQCANMRSKGYERVSEAGVRSEVRITNDAFSLIVVNPFIDERLIDEVFNTVDPYKMPNFEEEVRSHILRQEEEKQRLKESMGDQINFGELNADNSAKADEETEEQRQERIQLKVRKELENRVKTWRKAMKEQQAKMSTLRWDNFMLNRTVTYLRPGGILIMVTPKEFIDDMITFKLVNQFEDIRILRLEDDEYQEQRKCIIIAKKRMKATRDDYDLGRMLARTKERPYRSFGKVRDVQVTEDTDKYEKQVFRAKVDAMYSIISPQSEPLYTVPSCDVDEITQFRVGPVTASEALLTLNKSKLLNAYQEKYSQVLGIKEVTTPTPLHKGHILLLLTSGFLNGYIGTGPDQHLVKGSAIKDVREFQETDEDGNTKIVEREYYNIGVKILNAQGDFKKIM